MPHFDQLKARLFKTVTNHMGYRAAWLSSVSGLLVPEALGVTYKYPTLKEKQFLEWDEFVYEAPNRIMEYMEPDFPGLFDLVYNTNGQSKQNITIWDELLPLTQTFAPHDYRINSVRRMFDGSVVYAWLTPIELVDEAE